MVHIFPPMTLDTVHCLVFNISKYGYSASVLYLYLAL